MATAIGVGMRATPRMLQGEAGLGRNRRISREAGHALEVLGHAIEYLTDEYVLEARDLSAEDPRVAAIQLLMSLNRQVYFECPLVPTLTERFCAFLRRSRV